MLMSETPTGKKTSWHASHSVSPQEKSGTGESACGPGVVQSRGWRPAWSMGRSPDICVTTEEVPDEVRDTGRNYSKEFCFYSEYHGTI